MDFELIDNLNRHTVTILHRQYIDTILEHFKMFNMKSFKVRLDPGIVLSKADCLSMLEEQEEMQNVLYCELTGALLSISRAMIDIVRFHAQTWPDPRCTRLVALQQVVAGSRVPPESLCALLSTFQAKAIFSVREYL